MREGGVVGVDLLIFSGVHAILTRSVRWRFELQSLFREECGTSCGFIELPLKVEIEEVLDLFAVRNVADDTGEEAKPCPQVFRLLVGVEGAIFELWLQLLVVHGIVHGMGR